jgi:hypothetical protein
MAEVIMMCAYTNYDDGILEVKAIELQALIFAEIDGLILLVEQYHLCETIVKPGGEHFIVFCHCWKIRNVVWFIFLDLLVKWICKTSL